MIPKQKHSKSVLALMGAVFSVFLMSSSSPAHADMNKYQAHVDYALNVSIPYNSIDIIVNPSSRPFFASSFDVKVSTNNDTGYYMNMSSDSTELVNTNNHTVNIPTLSPLDGGYTQDTFETNKWGYKIGDNNFIPFATDTKIAESDTAVNEDTTSLTFATKVDFMQTPGIYENTVSFTIVANPTPMVLQDLEPAFCTETPTVMIDARDGEEYTVQRLADGKCWMLDNLRFDPTDSTMIGMRDKTNAPEEALKYLRDGGSTSPKYPAKGLNENINDYTSPYIVTQYKDMVLEDTPGVGSKKVGILYNYCALSAGTYCYNYDIDGGNAVYDLCPSGWRIPTRKDGTGDYETLLNALSGSEPDFIEALSLTAAGRGYDTPTGENGDYWSSSQSSNTQMWVAQIYPNGGNGAGSALFTEDKERSLTRSARCLMEERDLNDITYMQETTPRIVANTADGTEVTLTDYRDGQNYPVIKDTVRTEHYDNGWVYDYEPVVMMAKNLAIGCNGTGDIYGTTATSKPLDYATSNIENKWNTPTTTFAIDENAHMLCDSEHGAYYNYYAATSETEATIDIGSSIRVIDSKINICPRGWNIPGEEAEIFAGMHSDAFSSQLGSYYSAGKWNFDLEAVGYTAQGYTGWWWSDWVYGPYLWHKSSNDRWYNSFYSVSYDLWSADTYASGMYLRCSFLGD